MSCGAMQTSVGGAMALTPLAVFNEKCASLNVTAEFKLVSESGSPHEKLFTFTLTADNISVTSSGSSKQMAKQLAALNFFETVAGSDLGAKWGLTKGGTEQLKLMKFSLVNSRSESSLLKTKPSTDEGDVAVPPFLTSPAILHDMCRMNSWPDPVYTTVESFEDSSTSLFTVEAKVGPICLLGTGESVKEAEENAAEGILHQIKCDSQHKLRLFDKPKDNTQSEDPEHFFDTVSKLQDLCVKNKLPLPHYEEITEEGTLYPKGFIMSVKVLDMESIGHGLSKKAAKRNSAAGMLIKLKNAARKKYVS
ncbi:interferon inducible double stranded rna-dependen t protein kinase activator homolog [Trichuris trichiura]|uniref:Interferon inducible double stranded rna-dependen t protein kinase activator homolog n=1 Tax=Trichuris trichiura TaxID=36087 RepID=A0A077ZB63_TRITR|nr:interferon inducible double stranded rna-dependen t protein kinase activator homolog [Trichuris trichiura]